MKKNMYLLSILLILFLITGCSHKTNQNDGKERINLSDKYYKNGDYIKVDDNELEKLSSDTYVLFTYNNYCNLSVPCDEIFAEFMKKYNIDFLSIPFEAFKKTTFYETVKFAPSVLIIKENEIIAFLDAESDDDLKRYTDSEEFEKWLNEYIYFKNK